MSSLLILPTARDAVRRACAHVGRRFRIAGSCVTTISAERLLADCQTVLDSAPYREPHSGCPQKTKDGQHGEDIRIRQR